jgi:hypothetical protein
MKAAKQIAEAVNSAGQTYFGEKARAWDGDKISRIYFGRDFVTIENGEIHNRKHGKARALTIGDKAVALVKQFAE